MGKRANIVYEFDTPDVSASYLYPAIVREYRKGGVQFAALFSYDMLATAPWSLGWQTHNFNMVYTPQKSISAMIHGTQNRHPNIGSTGRWGHEYYNIYKIRAFIMFYHWYRNNSYLVQN